MARKDKSGGFFTNLFLEGLASKEKMNDSNHELNSSEISAYISWQVTAKKSQQTPLAYCQDEIVFFKFQDGKRLWSLGKTLVFGVGIDDYQQLPKLAGCVSDLVKIEKAFKNYGEENVSFIFLKNQEATRDNILKNLYKAVRSDAETVIFYYSGHSTHETLMPVETIESEPYLYGISVEILKKILHEVNNKRIIVISDTHLIWNETIRNWRYNVSTLVF